MKFCKVKLQLRPSIKSYVAINPWPFTDSSDLKTIVKARDELIIIGGFSVPQYLPIGVASVLFETTLS